MVLSHALRDGGVRDGVQVPGTTHKLAILVAEGRLSQGTLEELAVRAPFDPSMLLFASSLQWYRFASITSFPSLSLPEMHQTIFSSWADWSSMRPSPKSICGI